MKLFTRFTQAAEAAQRWEKQYHAGGREEVLEKLKALGPEPHPDDVDKAIGGHGGGWTTPPRCNECGASNVPTVQLGDEPDYDSSTACICGACLLKALILVDNQ